MQSFCSACMKGETLVRTNLIFVIFLRSPDEDAVTKWRPAQRTARYSLFLHSLGKNMSVSHGHTKHKLTETLLCLMYAFMSEKLRAALLACCRVRARGSHAPLSHSRRCKTLLAALVWRYQWSSPRFTACINTVSRC